MKKVIFSTLLLVLAIGIDYSAAKNAPAKAKAEKLELTFKNCDEIKMSKDLLEYMDQAKINEMSASCKNMKVGQEKAFESAAGANNARKKKPFKETRLYKIGEFAVKVVIGIFS